MGDVLRFKIDDLVIASYVGLAMVTHYSIAIRLIEYIGQLLSAVLGMFLPIFTKYDAKGEDDEMRSKFLIVTEMSVFLTLLLIPPLMILGKVFIELWMGEKYSDAYIPLLVLGAAAILAGCNRVCITALYATAKHKYYAKINLLEGGINLILSLLLVQYYGIIGVAFGTAISTVYIKAVLLPRYTCKVLEQPIFQYYRILFKHMICAAIYFSLSLWVSLQIVIDSYVELVLFSSIVCSIYALLSFFVFSRPLQQQLLKLMPKQVFSFNK